MARYEDLSINLLRMPAKTGAANQSSQVSLTLTPVSVAPSTTANQTFTIPGLLPTDIVLISDVPFGPAGVAPLLATATAANTLAVTYVNGTIGALVPTAGTYRFVVIKTQ